MAAPIRMLPTPRYRGGLKQLRAVPRRVLDKLHMDEMFAFLTVDPTSLRHRINGHHALCQTLANNAEARMSRHSLQRLGLPAPVSVTALRPMTTFDARTPEMPHRPEQLRHPLTFPIGKLLLGNGIKKLYGLRFATLPH